MPSTIQFVVLKYTKLKWESTTQMIKPIKAYTVKIIINEAKAISIATKAYHSIVDKSSRIYDIVSRFILGVNITI